LIAFDTNLVVRLLVADDREQLERVVESIAAAERSAEEILLTAIVLCEVAWVLGSVYRAPRKKIVEVFRELLAGGQFAIESRREVDAAFARFERGRGDFADYLIAESARTEGARTTFTLDRTLRREPGFTLI
jgi:predicted nucleic-acid-binding protein